MKSLVLLIFSFSSIVFSKPILFIDLNNAPLEIAAVSAGRTVNVVPTQKSISIDVRRQISKIGIKKEQVDRLSESCYVYESPKHCQILRSQYGITQNDQVYGFLYEQVKIQNNLLNGYGATDLENDIVSLPTVSYDTVIISGHHANGFMAGELLEAFSFDIFKKIVSQNPVLFSNVKYLVILGCDSGQEEIIKRWNSVFPSTQLVVASNGVAPTKTDPRNISFIKNLMNRIDTLKHNAINDSFDPKTFLADIKVSGWPAAVLFKNSEMTSLYAK